MIGRQNRRNPRNLEPPIGVKELIERFVFEPNVLHANVGASCRVFDECRHRDQTNAMVRLVIWCPKQR